MTRYSDLKRERDDAKTRAAEAERFSMREEVERMIAECTAKVATAEADRDLAYEARDSVIRSVGSLADGMARDVRAVLVASERASVQTCLPLTEVDVERLRKMRVSMALCEELCLDAEWSRRVVDELFRLRGNASR